MLDKVKLLALYFEEKNLAYEVLELEKIIESQYITRSMNNRADILIRQTREISALNSLWGDLSNLSLELYAIFLKQGYCRTEEEAISIKEYFKKQLPDYTFLIISIPKIQTGDLVVKNHDVVLIQPALEFCDLICDLFDELLVISKLPFHKL